ncbi:mRNA cleavage and polyadenylation specificity factor complex subunit Pta1 [Schizosaccharomyces osmophilus]|uniref:mRNA cleavage and polyadenylation specificity factor complex subunit Pta1 n=1 Tax=Schizosaccharomyces osmophilus TaxID=2545709 RepID=A0AAE9WGT0_9SCHI|nr:mRNA cleavage and polyadenylation specificity factor complex subunit Pta1 [Schizosaccharomyces osmophilus]WBW75418.1 mRNA cleavage and polyadenylation specificity factor complex subunit Pta1 [Schizosaccharomyces osmophilus]
MEQPEADEHIARLNQARDIVKEDESLFPDIVKNILSVANYSDLRFKKWMSSFLWFGFSSKRVDFDQKVELAVACLETISTLLSFDNDEVKKDIILCSCTLYPLVFFHCCTCPDDTQSWEAISKIKQEILSLFDSSTNHLKISCIKFISTVILAQSSGIRDPRLVTKSDVSLSKVPTNHPFLNPTTLKQESFDLFQKLFTVFSSKTLSPLFITSVLNVLPVIANRRKELGPTIIENLLQFHLPNPKEASDESATLDKLARRCIEKNLKVTLLHLTKNAGISSSLIEKIHAYLSGQIYQNKTEDHAKKRQASAPDFISSKRAKSSAVQSLMDRIQPRELEEDSAALNNPLVNIFASQAATNPLASFDVTAIPVEVVTEIVLACLRQLDNDYFHQQINMLRERVRSLSEPETLGLDQEVDEEEDDDYEPPEVDVQTINASVEREAARFEGVTPSVVNTDTYELPTSETLSPMAVLEYFHSSLSRLFDYSSQFERTIVSSSNLQNLTLENVDNTVWDKHHWSILLPRLCTRGLNNYQPANPDEQQGESSFTLSSFVRGQLFTYIASNWRACTNLTLNWLSEEWYNDRLMKENEKNEESSVKWEGPQYERWALRIIDSVLPYLEMKDKVFMIFLSELPELTDAMIEKVKFICLDPDKSKLGFMTLQYLIKFRLPARNQCLDLLQKMWWENEDVRKSAQTLLERWRPGFVKSASEELSQSNSQPADGESKPSEEVGA